ncbi:MAG: hypothetical protein TR69_WS6001001370 [candidate division WS6 bacterium OLB20]|uniref:Uncharacterized protein n=1 Tax=candidate division WS6 bacterium OLB20 TaxID=1617426 RepID=A0A136LWQ8_9BACT|nr:MAG: hypothetical protein TR69_WS6001001370 [candidate division WS6 bacterium OLB20]
MAVTIQYCEVVNSITGDSKRIIWIDAAKGLGIVLVILGHAGAPPHSDC